MLQLISIRRGIHQVSMLIFWMGNHASAFALASHSHPNATTIIRSGFMSAADKTKLDGIEAGAQVNQNAFSRVIVGSTNIDAGSRH
jgi:hypothetical protein